jgi:radical SAM superfamily enzyme YgiQ (UPF0313 family)
VPKVILVNPSTFTAGYSFITPRWLFVLAQATPADLIGDPVIVDEAVEKLDAGLVRPGDIVGVGITSGTCLAGYRVVREAKSKGATVIVGGIHATLFPDEPLEMGADAVVTGNGDVVWRQVVEDALARRLRKHYHGGRVPGDAMLKARWDLLDPAKYMFPTVQTVAGCPENCNFCSVWVVDGRQPRQRPTNSIIEEVEELSGLGFRYIAFADDNFNPATLGRIAREPSAQKRKELERVREDRLRFFAEYGRRIPKTVSAITQMTAEVIDDEEYFSAMYEQVQIRAALIGVESFSEEGLATANKSANSAGRNMVETIRRFQERGIIVMSSIISGLESDTVQTLETMRRFANDSGSLLAQFTFYSPYPGSKDYFEMVRDKENAGRADFTPKHKTQLLRDRFWLTALKPADFLQHPHMSREELIAENKKCWDTFYSWRETWKRTKGGYLKSRPLSARIAYVCFCLAFKRIYAGHGTSAADVRRKRMGLTTRLIVKLGVGVYTRIFRRKVGLRVSLVRSGAAQSALPVGRGLGGSLRAIAKRWAESFRRSASPSRARSGD